MVRTRFAPSPTGDLHLGNLRVAIFNYLFARGRGGVFLLRVEDTDAERNVPGALEGILRDLAWAGLEWDEGPDVGGPHGPYRQSERGERHRALAQALLEAGRVYRCFCSDEALALLREEGEGGAPGLGCPGGCRALDPERARERAAGGEPHTLRFPVPDARIDFDDAVRGPVSFHGRDVGDFVILRADGRATYNFAVVADDVDMEITHVIRGAGHLSNTPKHVLLFQALGATPPVFAHLPMVLGADRRKLSKREGAAGVEGLRAAGIPPEALLNYLSLLGWSPGDDREVLDREALIREMSLDRVGAADTVFDEEKLRWISQQHLARMSLPALAALVAPHVDGERFPHPSDPDPGPFLRALAAIRTRLHQAGEINEALAFLFPDDAALLEGVEEARAEPRGVEVVEAVRNALMGLEEWEGGALSGTVREVGARLGARGPALFHPVRLALGGGRSGPDLGLVMEGIGREATLGRLGRVVGPASGEGHASGSADRSSRPPDGATPGKSEGDV